MNKGRKRKYSIEFLQQIAYQNKGFCLSDRYITKDTKYEWMCQNHHKWYATAGSIIHQNTWCDTCARIQSGINRRKNLNHLQKLALKNKGKCLSESYQKSSTKYVWLCENGHNWSASANNIQRGKWCPVCKESHGERQIRNYLENNHIQYINQHTFINCYGISKKKKPLPFDFYLPTLNTCIEYDGEQHFHPIKSFGGISAHEKCRKNDELKTSFCLNQNIHLIRIPYFKFEEIYQILEDSLRNH